MAIGLLWAAITLRLFTWWLRARFWDTDSTLAVVLAWAPAVVVFGLAVASFFKPISKKALGTLFLVGGALLVALAVWLLVNQGLGAFGEAVGALVMALIALGAGLVQLHPPEGPTIQDRFVQTLVGSLPVARVGSFAVAAVCAGASVWLFLGLGWQVIYPEATGLFLIAVIFAGAGVWLAAAGPEEATPTRLRILVLMVGGLTGLVITLATVLRIMVWWTPVFAAGIRVWQGEAAWQVWACVYAALAGLAIMFGSLLLARADVRTNPVLRRVLYGYNTILGGLLLLAILVVLNIVVYVSYPYTFDWTQTRGIHTLSPSTRNLLEGLKEPAQIYVLMASAGPLTSEVHQLLDNASAYSDKLHVQYVSPDQDRRTYEQLVTKFPELLREEAVAHGVDEETSRGVLVVYGPESAKKPPHAFIPSRDLVDFKGGAMPGERKATRAFKGEDAIMTQLRFLANNQAKPKVYFTQGSGELNITDALTAESPTGQVMISPTGAGLLVDRLKKDNYEVRGLVWAAPSKKSGPGDLMAYAKKDPAAPDVIPEDAKLVVIAGPRTTLPKSAIDALDRYLQGNGKLMVFSNGTVEQVGDGVVYKPNGLETLLKKYNVEMNPDYILSLPLVQGMSFADVVVSVPPRSNNPIAANFRDYLFRMKYARTVRPGTGPGTFSAQTLLEAPKETAQQQGIWSETNWNNLFNLNRYISALYDSGQLKDKLSAEPLSVAVAVSDREQKPRMVIFGDSRFASNVVSLNAPYYDFIISSMEWLAERPANIGIKPKESSSFILGSNVSYRRMILLPVALMVLAVVGVGTGIWVVRRR
jgi:hypothetical protein